MSRKYRILKYKTILIFSFNLSFKMIVIKMNIFVYFLFVMGTEDKHYHARVRKRATVQNWPKEEEAQEFWRSKTENQIRRALGKRRIEKKAKNVILFLGDGMGIPSVTAGRILAGQKLGSKTGEEHVTHMENLDWVGLMKTYNVDHQSPDSAGTGTAYLSGIKARLGTIGLDAGAVREDCSSEKGHHVKTVFEKGQFPNLDSTLFIIYPV